MFRARDTRLNRDVAMKMLPKDFVADADRLRRFEQEAKTLATLNHPNILSTRQVGPFDPENSVESFGISPDGQFITIATWEQFFSIMMTEDLPSL